MARPVLGAGIGKRPLGGRAVGWQEALGVRVSNFEGAPSTGFSEDKYMLGQTTQHLSADIVNTTSITATLNVNAPISATISNSSDGTATPRTFVNRVAKSPGSVIGSPRRIRNVHASTPSTGVGEGAFFVSVADGIPYFVPASDGVPESLYEKLYEETLGERLGLNATSNRTGGTDIVFSSGDTLRSADSGAGVAGRPMILAPGTTVDTDIGALLWGDSYKEIVRGKAAIDLMFNREEDLTAIAVVDHGFAPGVALVGAGCDYSSIVGGRHHIVRESSAFSGIFAGFNHLLAFANHSTIMGGQHAGLYGETVTPFDVNYAAIIGGSESIMVSASQNSEGMFITGNSHVLLAGSHTAVFGGGHALSGADGADYNFVHGVSHGIAQLAVHTQGSNYNAVFNRAHDIWGAHHSVAMGRLCNLGRATVVTDVNFSFVGGNSTDMVADHSFIFGSQQSSNLHEERADFTVALGDIEFYNEMYNSHSFSFGYMLQVVRSVATTDATPTDLPTNFVKASTSRSVEMIVVARQTGGVAGTVGDTAMWLATAFIHRDGAGNTTLKGTPTGVGTSQTSGDAGAAAWSIAITADDVNEAFKVTVTGEVDKNISWVATPMGCSG